MTTKRRLSVAVLALAFSCFSCGDDQSAVPKEASAGTITEAGIKTGDGKTGLTGDGKTQLQCTKTGDEVCDGVDNDCNGRVDEGYTLLCQRCSGASCIEAKLAGGAFWVGAPRNLVIGDDRGIALPALPKAQPYIYIANSGDDTVSKIRTSDAVEVGRFLVGPNPSRTAVDGHGDAWVAMRGDVGDDGSGPKENVVKIAGDCIPKTKPPTPTRECILLDVPHVGNLLRGVAVDARNNVWIGAYAEKEAILIDGQTGVELAKVGLPGRPYGLAVDPDGYIWVSAHSQDYASGFVYRIDPVEGKADIQLGNTELENRGTYGLAADGEGGVWFASFSSTVFRVDGVTGAVGPVHEVGTTTRGRIAH